MMISKIGIGGWLFIMICGVLIVGCETAVLHPPTPIVIRQPPVVATPTLLPTAEIPPTPVVQPENTPTTTVPPDSGWQELHPRFERRTIHLFNDGGQQFEQLTILRIDPADYQFQVGYHPGNPQMLSDWQAETGALLVVNGGFFTEEYVATGLVVVDGESFGVSYGEFAGMFAVSGTGTEVRWLGERPYASSEPPDYALQAFPMLVRPGGVVGYPDEDGERARRTVVAQDGNGRILFIFAPRGGFTLHGLCKYLVDSDLNLDVALNLDGGTSTGMVLAETADAVLAYTAVPTVILVYPKP